MKSLSFLTWSVVKQIVFIEIKLCLIQAAERREEVAGRCEIGRKKLGSYKPRLVFLLTIPATVAFTSLPQPAAADDSYFYIVNSSTGMMAEVFAHRTDAGSPVVLWPHYGGASQQFKVQRLDISPGRYKTQEELWFLLRARHSDKCLKTNGFQSGAAVVQAVCGGDAAQLWRMRKVSMTAAECPSGQCFGGFRYVLENYYDRGRRCLDAANPKFPAPPAKGAGLQAWDCISSFSAPNVVNQEWKLVNIRDWGAPGPILR